MVDQKKFTENFLSENKILNKSKSHSNNILSNKRDYAVLNYSKTHDLEYHHFDLN